MAGWYERTRRADSNLFSIEELFNQRRIKANLDGSITTANAGWSLEPPASVIRREIAPVIFQDPNGDRWAFETKHGGLEIRLVLCIDIAVAAAVTFLLQADWEKRQVFVDGLDSWLIALYVAAWLGVLASPLVVWIAYRSWKESGTPLWARIHYTLVATAMMTAAWIAIEWRIAGTTLNY